MPTIEVLKDFVLTLDDHTRREFKKGVHVVDDYIADHWYVKAHAKPVESAEATPVSTNPVVSTEPASQLPQTEAGTTAPPAPPEPEPEPPAAAGKSPKQK